LRDPELVRIVEAVERHLAARRGRPCVLSPHDFALLREWHAAGVPLSAVLAALDRGLGEGDTVSLAYCRRFVERGVERAAQHPGEADSGADAGAQLLGTLLALEQAIAGRAHAAFERPQRLMLELRDLLAVSCEPNGRYLERALQEIDDAVAQAALESLPADEARGLLAEAEPAVARQRGLAPAVLAEAQRRHAARRARERLRLPRISRG
jgi:hypothetical protein